MLKDALKPVMVPIHQEGYRYIAIFAAITLVAFIFSDFFGFLGIILTAWCVYFFRDPSRVTPNDDSYIISPADGIVQKIDRAAPPAEIGGEETDRVCIFMNAFNVHVNRSPVNGRVTRIAYNPGKFFNASLDKASEFNERNSIEIEANNGQKYIITQIAGLLARRIVCWVREGEPVEAGERVGMIRFGSRVDVYLPKGAEVNVKEGQIMVAGETVIARLDAESVVKSAPKALPAPVANVVKKKAASTVKADSVVREPGVTEKKKAPAAKAAASRSKKVVSIKPDSQKKARKA